MFAFIRNRLLHNPQFARSSNDQWAFGIFLFGGHLAVWYELCHVLPHYHSRMSSTVWLHYIASIFIYVHWVISLYYFICTKTTGDFAELHAKREESWRYCTSCIEYFPPRSHHCPVCNACILKRDHHCWFGGCCVGHANHRFYCSLILYIWSAALYANVFHLAFLREVMGGLGIGTWLCVLVPHVAGITGFLTLHQFFVAVITFIAGLCFFMFTWLLAIQLAQLVRGQTKYERRKGYLVYNNGFQQNMRDIFGSLWFIAWLFPWLPSKLDGDGISFKKRVKER